MNQSGKSSKTGDGGCVKLRAKKTHPNNLWHHIGPIAKEIAKGVAEGWRASSLSQTRLLTGFKDLDEMTHGFKKTDLILLAGYPDMGQKELAYAVAAKIALRSRFSVAIFSMVHSKEFITQKFLASLSSVDRNILSHGHGPTRSFSKVQEAAKKLSKVGIYLTDEPKMSVDEIVNEAKAVKSKHNVGLIIVDDFQSIFTQEETSIDVLGKLRGLARSAEAPVMVVYQARYAEPRKQQHYFDRSDLGELVRFPDQILNMYRAEYDNPTLENVGKTEILIETRDYSVGYVQLNFIKGFFRFEESLEKHFTPTIRLDQP